MRIRFLKFLLSLLGIALASSGCALLTTPAPPTTQDAPTQVEATITPEPSPTVIPNPTSTPFSIPPDASSINIALSPSLTTLDPRAETSPEARALQSLIYQTLVNLDQNGNPMAGLAYGWEMTEDGLSYTFFLPQDATFSDGATITATVVAQNLEEFLLRGEQNANEFPYNLIETIEAVDDTTLAIRLRQPSTALLYALSNSRLSILSPDWLSRPPGEEFEVPAGSGPYQLIEHDQGNGFVFYKRPDYQISPVYFDVVRVFLTSSAEEMQNLLNSGEIQLAILPSLAASESVQIASESNPQAITLASPRLQVMVFNLSNPDLNSLAVRQALNLAIDRDSIIQSIFNGGALPLQGFYPPPMVGYCLSDPNYQYNPEKAQALLNQAGYGDGLTLRVLAPEGIYSQDKLIMEALVQNLASVGVNLKVDYTTRENYPRSVIETQPQANYDLYFMEIEISTFFPASLDPWVISGGAMNGGRYSNARVDEYLNQSAAELDQEVLTANYCLAGQQIWKDAPFLFLWQPGYQISIAPGLEGFTYSANGMVRLDLLREEPLQQE